MERTIWIKCSVRYGLPHDAIPTFYTEERYGRAAIFERNGKPVAVNCFRATWILHPGIVGKLSNDTVLECNCGVLKGCKNKKSRGRKTITEG